MPRFDVNLSSVSAQGVILDKGDYTFTVADAKPFARKKASTGEDIYGVRYTLQVTDGPDGTVGKTIPVSFYLHTDGARAMAKRFIMAVYGFTIDSEDEFNSSYGDYDWGGDTEGELGEGWTGIIGSSVAATVDVQPNKNPNTGAVRDQNQFSWRPA